MNERLAQLLIRAAALKEQQRQVAACLLVHDRGSTPASAGALMLVDDAAQTFGTIGGGCVEAEVRRAAVRMMQSGRYGVLQLKLDHDYGWDDGLICGGTIHVAVGELPEARTLRLIAADIEARRESFLAVRSTVDDDPETFTLDLPPRPRLIIAGGGHVGQALARLAVDLDFEVTVVDDRADLLQRFFSEPVNIVAGDIGQALRELRIDSETYCVIVTRGHRHDEQALEACLGRGATYVGMIGSRRKVKLIFDDLVTRVVDPAELQKVFAPIGLGIGAVTVPEIAVAIAAQLVEVRRSAKRDVVRCQIDTTLQRVQQFARR